MPWSSIARICSGLLILLATPKATAQQVSLSFDGVYGSYLMTNLTNFMKQISDVASVDIPIVKDFPASIGYQFKIGIQKDPMLSWGFAFGYSKAAGLAQYQDATSMANVDLLVKGYSAGLFGSYQIIESENWPLFASFQASYLFSTLDVYVEERQGSSVQSESLSLMSSNLALRPTIGIQHNFTKRLFFSLDAGYEMNIAGSLNTSGGNQSKLTVQWDGFRLLLGIGIKVGSDHSFDYYQ